MYLPIHSVFKSLSFGKYAYKFIDTSFDDTTTHLSYKTMDIVLFFSSDDDPTYCFKFYDTSKFPNIPILNSDIKYESISAVLKHLNYRFAKNLNTRPPNRINQALQYPYAVALCERLPMKFNH
jgi:hypothetical protein